jgi:hypothetical protein
LIQRATANKTTTNMKGLPMMRTGLAVIAVFVIWVILNFLLHGLLLTSSYAATPQLWRPMTDIKMGLTYFVTLVSAACFVLVYAQFIVDKSLKTATLYGLIVGIGAGIAMGYGSYAVMPIPYVMALAWFLGSVVNYVVGALAMGLVLRTAPSAGKA